METGKLIAARHSTHGDYKHVAHLDRLLKDVLRSYPGGWDKLNDEQSLALEMICHKMARILCGDPNFKDHWADIIGYSELVLRSIGGKP